MFSIANTANFLPTIN